LAAATLAPAPAAAATPRKRGTAPKASAGRRQRAGSHP
jgi:hypothetical protein